MSNGKWTTKAPPANTQGNKTYLMAPKKAPSTPVQLPGDSSGSVHSLSTAQWDDAFGDALTTVQAAATDLMPRQYFEPSNEFKSLGGPPHRLHCYAISWIIDELVDGEWRAVYFGRTGPTYKPRGRISGGRAVDPTSHITGGRFNSSGTMHTGPLDGRQQGHDMPPEGTQQ